MDRRDTLKAIGGIGAASLLGVGASSTALADEHANGGNNNPGRVGTYDGYKTLVPPDLAGFDKVLLYIADGNPNPDWDGVAYAEQFQREIMDCDDDEIIEDKQAAVDFYADRFGLDFPDANEEDLFTSVSSECGVDATLDPLMLDPDVGYTAYVMAGEGCRTTTETTPPIRIRTPRVRCAMVGGWPTSTKMER